MIQYITPNNKKAVEEIAVNAVELVDSEKKINCTFLREFLRIIR